MTRTAPKTPLFAGLVLVAVALSGCGGQGGTPAAPSTSASTSFELSGATAKCVRPVALDHLRDADVALEGTVTGVSKEFATLRVTRVFRGEPGETVRLRLRNGLSEALSGSGEFQQDRAYLITASAGNVADCLSGPADDPSLADSYAQAFPGQ